MRYFARLLDELKDVVHRHKPGDPLVAPSLLSTVAIHGHNVSYFQMGLNKDGPAVILLHGFGGFFMDWPRVMVPLSKKYRVFALDLPGWGFSAPRPENKTMGLEDDAETIREFIQCMGLEEVILVGISYGAAVAWASAAMKVKGISQVVLLNPMPPFPLRYLKSPLYRIVFMANSLPFTAKWLGRLMNKMQYKLMCKENLKNHRLLETLYLDLGYLVLKQPHIHQNLHLHARKAKTIDWSMWEKMLGRINLPVTIMQGVDDRVFTMKSAKYLRSLIPHSKLIEVKDCGHAMVFDQHRKITAYLLYLLKVKVSPSP